MDSPETVSTLSNVEGCLVRTLSATGLPIPLPDWLRDGGAKDAESEPEPEVILLRLGKSGAIPSDRIRRLSESASVVVDRDGLDSLQRREALQAGAFGCLTAVTELADRIGLVVAAARYQKAQDQIRTLKRQSEEACRELVISFGTVMESFTKAKVASDQMQEALDEVRLRIVKILV